MAILRHVGRGVVLAGAVCLAALAAAGPPAAAPPIRSDGSVLNEGFDGPAMPAGWEMPGGGRQDVSFRDGQCIFNPGKGDNYLRLPWLPVNLDEDFVLELAFSIPTPVSGTFSILTLTREGGEFQVLIVPAGPVQNVTMTGSRPLGPIAPGKAYTLAMQVFPDGTYKGALTGPDGETPGVQVVDGVDGALHRILVGNGYGAAEGALSIDRIRIGRRTQ